jgi:hypothetical protein
MFLVGFYVWAIEGVVVYTTHLRGGELKADYTMRVLGRGLMVFCVINAVDFCRNITIVLCGVVSHFYCKRRARHFREGRRLWWEQRISNDPLLSDIERYYRHRDF